MDPRKLTIDLLGARPKGGAVERQTTDRQIKNICEGFGVESSRPEMAQFLVYHQIINTISGLVPNLYVLEHELGDELATQVLSLNKALLDVTREIALDRMEELNAGMGEWA